MDHNKIAVELFNKLAETYQEKYGDVGLYRRSLDTFCSLLGPSASILEVACGPGNVTRYLLNKRPDLKVTATDLAPNMVRLASANNPEATVSLLDGRNIKSLNNRYNAVMCSFMLPYLNLQEAQQFISDAADILHPGGILYVSTMEDSEHTSEWKKGSSGDSVLMHYHSLSLLDQILQKKEMKIFFSENIQHPTQVNTTTLDLILIAELNSKNL
jgi:ubiquinone/menaquinone biosynthesis C-methylase UbiE